jgi:hypothetical protein
VLRLAPAVEPFATATEAYLELTEESLERALVAGWEADDVAEAVLALVPEVDETVQQRLAASTEAGAPCRWIDVAAFVEIPDETLREALMADTRVRELIILPSPPGGVLVRPGVTANRVRTALRRHGKALATAPRPAKSP